jgi:hypothetical protein
MITHIELAAIYFGLGLTMLGLQHIICFKRTFK